MMMISTERMLAEGLMTLQIEIKNKSFERQVDEFCKHYGAVPAALSKQWFDLTTTQIKEVKLSEKEKTEKGLKTFLRAHYFLWNYPKNSNNFASRFKICERYTRQRQTCVGHGWKDSSSEGNQNCVDERSR